MVVGTLLSIGAFARAAGIPATALRFYDEIGLLPAAHVDPSNSYRYYDPAQQAHARLIAELRKLEVSVEDMRTILLATPQARDAHLEQLATRVLERAAHQAHQLRALSTTSPTGSARFTVNGPDFADALRAAATFTGQAPLDAIMLAATPIGIRCLATDRYRLTDFFVPAHGTGTMLRVLRMRHTHAAVALLDSAETPHVSISDTALNVDQAHIPLGATDAFPDLGTLADSFEHDAGTPIPVENTWTHTTAEAITVPVGSQHIRFTTHLLAQAANTLGETGLAIAAPPFHAAVVLTHENTPTRRIIVMPRTTT